MALVPRNLNAIGLAAESFSCPKQLDVARKDGRVGSRGGVSGLRDWAIYADNCLRATDKTSIYTVRSDRNQMVSDRILHQFGIALGVKNFHDAVFVKGHGASCKV